MEGSKNKEKKTLEQNMGTEREHDKKAEWINNMKNMLQVFKEIPKMKIDLDSHKNNTQKNQIDKNQAMMTYMYTGLKNSIAYQNEQIHRINKHTRMDD